MTRSTPIAALERDGSTFVLAVTRSREVAVTEFGVVGDPAGASSRRAIIPLLNRIGAAYAGAMPKGRRLRLTAYGLTTGNRHDYAGGVLVADPGPDGHPRSATVLNNVRQDIVSALRCLAAETEEISRQQGLFDIEPNERPKWLGSFNLIDPTRALLVKALTSSGVFLFEDYRAEPTLLTSIDVPPFALGEPAEIVIKGHVIGLDAKARTVKIDGVLVKCDELLISEITARIFQCMLQESIAISDVNHLVGSGKVLTLTCRVSRMLAHAGEITHTFVLKEFLSEQ